MRVLLLGPPSPVFGELSGSESIICTEDRMRPDHSWLDWAEFIISYRYKHKVPQEVLDLFPNRAINIHLGLLPFCRGVHPVFFTVIHGYPFGTTIHEMDARFDTGPVLTRTVVEPRNMEEATFRVCHREMQAVVVRDLKTHWQNIKCGRLQGQPQSEGNYHSLKEFNRLKKICLPNGWDTPLHKAKELHVTRS